MLILNVWVKIIRWKFQLLYYHSDWSLVYSGFVKCQICPKIEKFQYIHKDEVRWLLKCHKLYWNLKKHSDTIHMWPK